MTAETKRIAECIANRPPDGGIRGIIQIAVRIRSIQVDRWWNDAVDDRKDRGNGLHCAGGTQEVACHGLRRADTHLERMIPEGRFQRFGLADVSERSGGPMNIDIIDEVRLDSRIAE